MSKLDKYKPLSDFINGWLKIIAIFSAGLFTINEYLEHKESEQIKRSLNYVERYNSNKLLDMRNLIAQKLDYENKRLISTLSEPGLSEEALNKAYRHLMLEIVKVHHLSIPLKTLFAFHEEVVLCVKSSLCNEQVARDFFSRDAIELFNGFYPIICEQRRKWKNDAINARIEAFYIYSSRDICI